jgi:hypothetical protein
LDHRALSPRRSEVEPAEAVEKLHALVWIPRSRKPFLEFKDLRIAGRDDHYIVQTKRFTLVGR